MRVLVYEPKFVGHFLGFAGAAARAFDEAGCDVTLALSTHARDTTAAGVKLADLPPSVRVAYACDVPKVYQKWTNAKLESAALGPVLDEVPADWLVVPSADFLLTGLTLNRGLRRRVERLRGADLVLHNCRQTYPRVGLREWPTVWFDRYAVTLNARSRLHTVDEYAVSDAAARPVGLWGRPVSRLPHFYDPWPDRVDQAAARQRLGLDGRARWIGSAGDLGRRKGTELLINGFASSGAEGDRRLALFGALSESVKQTLREHAPLVEAGRIVLRDRYVSEQEFRDFFPAMDVVWTGYPRQVGMASTQLFAADADRPVIAIDYGGVGWAVRHYGLGVVCQPTVASVAGAIRSSLETPTRPLGAQRFLARHTTEGFNRELTAGARALLGTGASTGELVSGGAR